MFDDKKNLNLNKTYSYTVSVKDKDQNFAGKLTLSPDKCTLKVMGERSPSCDFYQSSQIECSSFDKSFMLFELSNVSGSFQNLQYAADKQIGFFEYEFEVGFVICSEGNLRSYDDTISFCIKSAMIYKWVGYTNLQQELIEKYQARTLNPLSDSLEFEQILEGYGKLRLFYHYQTHNNVLEFRTGLNFPPKLSVHFSSPIRMNNLHFEYKKFYHLMALFIGSDFKVNEVTITTNRQISTFNTSIYFPKPHQSHERDYPVFPLSLNLRFYGENDVNLPLESFNNYYNLKEEDRIIFTRYLRYQRMKSNEEKFLGFFRLLESLTIRSSCYVDPNALDILLKESQPYILEKLKDYGNKKSIKSLISRIGRTNMMKYNTSKCIEDFFKRLPSYFRDSINIMEKDIQAIVKLRNDITHANSYSINDRELEKYTSFIKALLYIALLEKIGIPSKTSATLIYRLDGYHHLQDLT